MRIVIIGGGIAGLSAYIFLHKHIARNRPDDCSIKIYEAYDIKQMRYDTPGSEELKGNKDEVLFTPKVIGNAIGLGKNGLAVLRRMDDEGEILQRIQEKGNCIAKWRMGTARGWKIVDANVQSSVENGENGEEKIADTIMIARQVAWEVLRDQVLGISEDAVVRKKVSRVENTTDGRIFLHFIDGTKDEADLLVGADGLRSIARQTIFKNNTDYEPRSWLDWLTRKPLKKKDYITPHYGGLTGLGGFVPSEVLKKTDFDDTVMSITFGPNGFFGHGYIGPVSRGATDSDGPLAAWWSTFSSDSPQPYQMPGNSNTSTDPSIKTTLDKKRAVAECLNRYRSWSDPTIQAILDHLEEHQGIDNMYPTYTTPELPTWKNVSNIVLLGDAAHALQPSSGQGACQAMEDAEALSLFLKHYLERPAPSTGLEAATIRARAMEKALSDYVAFRKPRLAKIYKQSQKMGGRKMDMGIFMEYTTYAIIWVVTKIGMWEKYNRDLFEFDLPREVEKFVRGHQSNPEKSGL